MVTATVDATWPTEHEVVLPGRLEAVLLILACYVLSLGTFENFGNLGGADRFVPEHLRFDAIAAFKAGTRLLSAGLVVCCLWRLRRSLRWPYVTACFLPLLMFGCWAVVTALWSPLWSYTFGHALEFLLLVAIALAASLLCVRPEHFKAFLRHACLLQFIYLAILVILSLLDPQNARIVRTKLETESVMFGAEADTTFVKNPSEIACIAALAWVLLLNLRLLWGWRWTRWLMVPGAALAGWLLIVTQTRAILASAIVLTVVTCLVWGNRRLLALGGLALCLGAFVYLAADPYLERAQPVVSTIEKFVSRGQSSEELRGLGGRLGNWTGVTSSLAQHPFAMIHGYGYSMATPTGMKWHEDAWRRYTGHNMLLDVFAGTGIIGLLLFLWGFGRLGNLMLQGLRDPERRLPFLALAAILFAFLTGVFGDSIVGPMDPTSVGLFLILGIGLWRYEAADAPASVAVRHAPVRRNVNVNPRSATMTRNVLIVHESLPFHGGVANKFRTLARRLPQGAYHFGCLERGVDSMLPALAEIGMPTVDLGGRAFWPSVLRLRRYLWQNQIRLAFACSIRVYCALRLATFLMPCPVVFWLCDFSLMRKPAKRVLFYLISMGHWLLASSGLLLAAHVRSGRKLTALLYNGVEAPPISDKGRVRTMLEIPADATLLLYAADYQPFKDHTTLLRAFRQLAARHGDLYLALCGREGNLAKDIMNPDLLGAPWCERVLLFGPREDLPRFYSAADIYVHTCYEEGFGLAVAEAMLAGLPVVAPNSGALPEVVGRAGVLFKPRDPEALSEAVETLLGDVALRVELGAKAKARASQAFDPDRFARKFQEICHHIMKEGSTR